MYLPKSFEETRIEVLHALMRRHPLSILVTSDESSLNADHIPVQVLPQPLPYGLLRGHVARANPVWRHAPAREALAVFQGPHAYISPSLYPTKQQTGEVVPTWDYAVVHAYGTLRFIHDAGWLLALVASLTDSHEARRRTPWTVDDAPPGYIEHMLRAIVGFEFCITRISGKWKVSQNRNAADQQGVVTGLRATGDPQSLEIATLLAEWGAAGSDGT